MEMLHNCEECELTSHRPERLGLCRILYKQCNYMECIRCLEIEFVTEDDIIKVKWRHGDKHYIVPLGGLLELWEKYKEQKHG